MPSRFSHQYYLGLTWALAAVLPGMFMYCIWLPWLFTPFTPPEIKKHARRKKLCQNLSLLKNGLFMSYGEKHGLCFCSFCWISLGWVPAMLLAPLYAFNTPQVGLWLVNFMLFDGGCLSWEDVL